jgi:hypothetical protein
MSEPQSLTRARFRHLGIGANLPLLISNPGSATGELHADGYGDPDMTRPFPFGEYPITRSQPRLHRRHRVEIAAMITQGSKSVNRRLKGTPYRRAIGTPFWGS